MSKEAMKLALEAIEAAIKSGDWKVDGACDPDMAITALRQALAEQPAQQEPVAWARNLTDPQPHCVTDLKYMSVADTDAGVQYTPLYTSPPAQRKPLDAGEISRLWKQHTSEDGPHHNPYDDDGLGFARAIEAKLKEKNT